MKSKTIATSSQGYAPKLTHHEGEFLFTLGEANIYAGSDSAPENNFWDLVVCLTNSPTKPQPIISLYGAEELFTPRVKESIKSPTLNIPIPDGGIPMLDYDWWINFIKELAEVKGDVLIHCMAGRGRTGLFVCSILGLMKEAEFEPPVGMEDPVKWLREKYDPDVVESPSQVLYLQWIGVETIAKSSNSFGRATGGYSSYKSGQKWDSKTKRYIDPVEEKDDPLADGYYKLW